MEVSQNLPLEFEQPSGNKTTKVIQALNPKFEPLLGRTLLADSRRELNKSATFVEHINRIREPRTSKGLFIVQTASQWIEQAKERPIPKMLFGQFWFEFEICILFADTNLGKSILAVQIGNSISKGEHIRGFPLEAEKQMILYFDFELNDKQFESRYSMNYQQHYTFDDNFIRIEIDPDATVPEDRTFDEFLRDSIESSLLATNAKVLIIDNLTYLSNETEKARDALPLMKHLKALKSKYNLSILVIAHTPKRDLSKPITRNDLAGSKMLINFTDSCFTVGESASDKNLRYLKQIKVRQNEFIYDGENVCVCQLHKPNNFVEFELINYGSEREHLKIVTEKDRENQTAEIKELKAQGKSYRDIGASLGISHMTVCRLLKGTQA
ncbi:AAA family ATPase [Dyadobacter sp. CY107]|uniref:AAA family ATPase n=1 Tax=Dyadobacter fanqingshengii TaxID=2906443 RepID=UPI001F364BB5|nr:AAA family ATPase [Dyadobacter fanqingshengii]MCF2506856.1 AAA family ATPase [Dyadobacter fanqingshengii]